MLNRLELFVSQTSFIKDGKGLPLDELWVVSHHFLDVGSFLTCLLVNLVHLVEKLRDSDK